MSHHNIKLEILTPVHIGTSREETWQKNLDFFHEGDTVYVVRQDDIFREILVEGGEQALAGYSARIGSQRIEGLLDFISQYVDIEELAYLTFDYSRKIGNEIKPLLRTGLGTPILAGSSIKGSIRTAILKYLMMNDQNDQREFFRREDNLGRRRGRKLSYADSDIQRHYLGRDPSEDLFRMLQISDFDTDEEKTILHKTQTVNLYGNSWNIKQPVSTFLECINLQTTTGRIQIPQKQIENNQRNLRRTDLLHPKKLFEIINEYTLALLDKEFEFWDDQEENTHLHEFIHDYQDKLDELYQLADGFDTSKSCLLRVGAGSGWDFITGRWTKDLLDSRTWENIKSQVRRKRYSKDVPFPKSRKALEQGMPLGFVKLTWLNIK